MMLKQEYEGYIKVFNNNVTNVRSDSPEMVSLSLVDLSGVKFRVGQIIADIDLEYSQYFSNAKDKDKTDKDAQGIAAMQLYDCHGVSKAHFERMYKDLETLIQSLKKRIAVLASDYQQS
jgi:hypothetical protein